MSRSVASHLGIHSLPNYPIKDFQSEKGLVENMFWWRIIKKQKHAEIYFF